MNKKFLFAMALPLMFTACSQEELVSENSPAQVKGNAISGLRFDISKEIDPLTRATMNDQNILSFEKDDNISLYWMGTDGEAYNGKAEEIGKSNSVYYTEDGASFQSKAVVYEGYNLLVYPADLGHVTASDITVSLDAIQKDPENYVKNWVYVSDSALQIHKPVVKEIGKKKYWVDPLYGTKYGAEGDYASAEDVIANNISGYNKGLSTALKPLQTDINLTLRLKNAPSGANVVVNKVEFVSEAEMFSLEGKITAGAEKKPTDVLPNKSSKAQYLNPWYTSTEASQTIAVDCSKIVAQDGKISVHMLVNPIVADMIGVTHSATGEPTYSLGTSGKQPKLKVYTNYGVVTIGGSDGDKNNQLRAIFKKDGTTAAAATDNEALLAMLGATQRKKYIKVGSEYREKNIGWYIPRVVDVDLNNADIDNMHVASNEELNNILNAAQKLGKKELNVYLDADKNGTFVLTDVSALNAFTGNLTLKDGNDDKEKDKKAANNLKTVKVATTTGTTLPKITVDASDDCSIEIPATSSITTLAAGNSNSKVTYTQSIINKKATGLTVGSYCVATINNQNAVLNVDETCEVTLISNAGGVVNYTDVANYTDSDNNRNLNLDGLTTETLYGTIAYTATKYDNMVKAMEVGVNEVTINNIELGFFSQGINAADAKYPAVGKGGIEIIFNACGDLKELKSLNAETVTLKGGTKCTDLGTDPNMRQAKVWNLYGTTTLGKEIANSLLADGDQRADLSSARVNVWDGNATINGVKVGTIAVYEGATADITKHAWVPGQLAVAGTVTYSAKGATGTVTLDNKKYKVDPEDNQFEKVVITGKLTTNANIAAKDVYVGSNTVITLNGTNLLGVGAGTTVYATKYEQIDGTTNFHSAGASKQIWSGKVKDWESALVQTPAAPTK